jgi:hypothetical protein
MIKRAIISLLFGIFIVLAYAPYDPWVKEQVGLAFKTTFEKNMGCRITFSMDQINLLSPTLILNNVCVAPLNDKDTSWQWRAKKYSTGFSWANLFIFGSIEMWAQIDQLSMQSALKDNELAIAPHLALLMVPPNFAIPLHLQSLVMKKAQFKAQDDETGLKFALRWNSESRLVGDQFKTRLYLADANAAVRERTFFSRGNGNILIDIQDGVADPAVVFRIDARMWLPHLTNEESCFISGSWRNNHGRFSMANAQDSLRIDPIIITTRNGLPRFGVHARVPLSYYSRLMRNDPMADDVRGTCELHLQGALDASPKLKGTITLEDVGYRDYPWRVGMKTSFVREDAAWSGDAQLHDPLGTAYKGSWNWHETEKNGALYISNTSTIQVPKAHYWHVAPGKCELQLQVRDPQHIVGNYSFLAHNTVLSDTINASGTLSCDNYLLNLFGLLNEKPFTVSGDCTQFPYLKRIVYGTGQDKVHLAICHSPHKESGFSGNISVGLIRALIAQLTDYNVQGEGMAHIDAFIDEHDIIKTHIQLENATVRLPQTYNFINGLRAHIDYDGAQRSLRLHDLVCTMHSGSFTVERAVCTFDDAWRPSFVHLPMVFDHCLLNMKKDLFAMVSGHALLEKRDHDFPHLRGRIIVDRAQLKENVLSQDLQKKIRVFTGSVFDVRESDVRCNLGIETREAIRVDTPFLQANVAVDLHVNESVLNPSISGTISLLSGSLRFPYKPLYITKGVIRFVPGQESDPLIDLIARNKVKQHNVTLHVSGSLLNHQIILESTPPLAEEQIIALLLVGSHDQSLNSIMPALIMQNLRHLIFDATQTSFFERYLMPFDKSFKISLVPSFADQTGRGGLRGSLEIDVNDRWRAMIQKNFSLTEDTRVEIEYLFSDDITVRAIRDERRDMGGEIEMRWKF